MISGLIHGLKTGVNDTHRCGGKKVRLEDTMSKLMTSAGVAIFAALIGSAPASAQDAAAGEKVFAVCKACHQVGDKAKNAVGPSLNGLFRGRKAGTWPDYKYSDAYKSLDKTWDKDNFVIYIKDPRGVTPGTKMAYAGLKDDQKIKDLVAFLDQYETDGTKKQ
jgi:cytochrome c